MFHEVRNTHYSSFSSAKSQKAGFTPKNMEVIQFQTCKKRKNASPNVLVFSKIFDYQGWHVIDNYRWIGDKNKIYENLSNDQCFSKIKFSAKIRYHYFMKQLFYETTLLKKSSSKNQNSGIPFIVNCQSSKKKLLIIWKKNLKISNLFVCF